jgi:hypothetical protein
LLHSVHLSTIFLGRENGEQIDDGGCPAERQMIAPKDWFHVFEYLGRQLLIQSCDLVNPRQEDALSSLILASNL